MGEVGAGSKSTTQENEAQPRDKASVVSTVSRRIRRVLLGRREDPRTKPTGGVALVAVFIAFVPLAFSEDFLDAAFEAAGWTWLTLVSVDSVLLGLILLLALRLQWPLLERGPDWGLLAWGAAGAALTLALDTAVAYERVLPDTFWGDLSASLLYIVSLGLVLAATVAANPTWVRSRPGRDRDSDQEAWRRFRPALPLLIGTLAAYVGSVVYWRELVPGTIRTIEHARKEAMNNPDLAGAVINDLCVGAVHQEYFAQVSQVIPLLLVALGIERRFFEPFLQELVPRAMIIFTVVILCAGEALAISALPEPNEGCGDVLYRLHEYAAFILTLEACFVALAMLVWALVLAKQKE